MLTSVPTISLCKNAKPFASEYANLKSCGCSIVFLLRKSYNEPFR